MQESRFYKELKPLLVPTTAYTAPTSQKTATTGRALYDKSDDLGVSTNSGSGFSTTYAKNFIKQTATPKAQSTGGYRSGAKVMHQKFGEGTIIAVKGTGENITVDVAFKGIGVKTLSAKFAPMKVIG